MRKLLLALALLLALSTPAAAQLANSYPGDNGICSDPAVKFCEMFEDTVAAVLGRWVGDSTISDTFVTGATGQSLASTQMALVVDAPAGSGGTRSMRTRATGGGSFTTVQLSRDLQTNCPAPCNELYFRWYVKYSSVEPVHHVGMWLVGQNPKSAFLPSTCCNLPTGSDRFYVGAEPGSGGNPPTSFDLYSGWMGMQPDPSGLNYFGNTFIPNTVQIVYGQWHCVEVRIKMNNPVTATNGEMQLWLDNVEIINIVPGLRGDYIASNIFQPSPSGATTFPGFQWRNNSALELSKVWLNHFSDLLAQGAVQDVQWDHLVVATQRVGPIATSTDTQAPTTPGTPSLTNVTSQSLAWAWSPSTDNVGIVNYRWEGCTGAGCSTFVELTTTPTASITETNLVPNTLYRRRVRAWDGTNFSAYSAVVDGTTLTNQTLFIRFTDQQADGVNQETGFTVTRAIPGGTFSTVATPGPSAGSGTTVTVQDTSAPRPTACYQVCANNALGCSSPVLGGATGVCFTASTPQLQVVPTTLTFNAQVGAAVPASQAIALTNVSGTGMTWTVADNANWLSVTPTSGTDNQQLTVSANHATCATDCPLPAGNHTGIITITAPGAIGSPQTVTVTFNVAPAGSPGGTTPGTSRGGRVR